MENIRKYLDNLFMTLPQNSEVLRAKAELLQMMEDKYEELLQEGKTEQEAFGIVISEFGSLEEIADDIGIGEHIHQQSNDNTANPQPANIPKWDLSRTESFLSIAWSRAKKIALGVLFFILAPAISELMESIGSTIGSNAFGNAFSPICLFGFVALGVFFCIEAKRLFTKFGYDKKKTVALDLASAEFIKTQQEKDEDKLYKLKVTGILLCVFSVLPSAIFNFNGLSGAFLDLVFFLMVAVGVGCLIIVGSIHHRYNELSKSNVYNNNQMPLNADYFVEKKSRKMPGWAIALIVAAGVIIAGITIASTIMGVMTLSNLVSNNAELNAEKLVSTQKIDSTRMSEISIKADAQNVKFESTDDSQVELSYYGNEKNSPEITYEGNTMLITKKSKNSIIGIGTPEIGTIVVKIPSSVTNYNYVIDLDAGNVNMTKITGNNLTLNIDAGKVNLTESTFANATCDVDAGDVTLNKDSFQLIKAKVDAGNIEFTPSEPYNSYNYDVKASLGKITVGNNEQSGADTKYTQGASDTSNGSHSFTASVDMGNVTVNAN